MSETRQLIREAIIDVLTELGLNKYNKVLQRAQQRKHMFADLGDDEASKREFGKEADAYQASVDKLKKTGQYYPVYPTENPVDEVGPRGSAMRQPSTPGGRAARLGTTGVYHAQLGMPAKRGPGDTDEPDDVNIEPSSEPAKHVSRPIRPVVGTPNYKAIIATRGKGPKPTYTQADVDTYDKQYPPEKPVKPVEDAYTPSDAEQRDAEERAQWARDVRDAEIEDSPHYRDANRRLFRQPDEYGGMPRFPKKPAKPVDEIDAYAPKWGKPMTPEEEKVRQAQLAAKREKLQHPTRQDEISPELARKYLYAPGGGSHRYVQAMKTAKRMSAAHGPTSPAARAADAEAQRQGGLYHHAVDTAHRDTEQAQGDAVGERVDFMKEISPELAARYLYAPGGGAHRYIAAMKAARKAKQYGPEAEKAAQAAAEKAGGHYHHAMKSKDKYLDRTDKPIEGCR